MVEHIQEFLAASLVGLTIVEDDYDDASRENVLLIRVPTGGEKPLTDTNRTHCAYIYLKASSASRGQAKFSARQARDAFMIAIGQTIPAPTGGPEFAILSPIKIINIVKQSEEPVFLFESNGFFYYQASFEVTYFYVVD